MERQEIQKQQFQTFEDMVDYLYNMPRFIDKNTMEDTRAHLVRLGSPDRKIKKVIHVAGTNGKGSVCSYLRYCLNACGKRVASFTSPHLVDIRERFTIDGEMMSKEDFCRLFLQVYESLDWEKLSIGEGYYPTFSEYLFFMGMLYFAEKDSDYCILETGLGGRLDATNAVAEKDLCVITRIGLDHVKYLGDTCAKIAGEKAGIMRAGVPVVYCADVDEATSVFVDEIEKMQITGFPVSKKDYVFSKIKNKNIDFSLQTRYYGYIGVTLHTMALYQMENATLAVRALEVLLSKEELTKERIQTGLAAASWPGRMEEVLPEVFVDGAHNEDGIRAFMDTVRADGCEERHQGRTLIFSVVSDKDYKSMIQKVLEGTLFHRVFVTHMETKRAADMDSLRELWTAQAEKKVELAFFDKVEDAIKEAFSSQNGDRVYIAGSLYLVGEIKEFFDNDQF